MAIIWSLILFLESVFDINSRHKTALAFSIGISSFPLIGHYLLELGSQNQYLTYLPINALTILLIFPFTLIYVQQLTLVEKNSIHKLFKYLLPSILAFIFFLSVYISSSLEIKQSVLIYRKYSFNWLSLALIIINFTFIIEMIRSLYHIIVLLYKHRHEPLMNYATPRDTSICFPIIQIIAFSCIACICATFAIVSCNMMSHSLVIILNILLTINIFAIGYIGLSQKKLHLQNNNQKETKNNSTSSNTSSILSNDRKDYTTNEAFHFSKELNYLLEHEKIYLDSQLNINKLAQKLGTNRSYLSRFINEEKETNFNNFLNSYRLQALHKYIEIHKKATNTELCEIGGFGSPETLRRVIKAKTGLTIRQWIKSK